MCTVIVAWRLFDSAPLCVAANRDEHRDRPASPPERWDRTPGMVAPVDERAGGTWIGYNEAGVWVSVTNRWVDGNGDRSRGLLTRDALGARSADAVVERVTTAVEEDTYAPFQIACADNDGCYVLVFDGADLTVRELEPGLHVVVNIGVDGNWEIPAQRTEPGIKQANRAALLRSTLAPLPDESPANWLNRAGRVLGDHAYDACRHEGTFGTRSSSLLQLGDTTRYLFADGPPCETTYTPVGVSPTAP